LLSLPTDMPYKFPFWPTSGTAERSVDKKNCGSEQIEIGARTDQVTLRN